MRKGGLLDTLGLVCDGCDQMPCVCSVQDIPQTLDGAITVFLNRWHWRGDRAVVERELRDLITQAQGK